MFVNRNVYGWKLHLQKMVLVFNLKIVCRLHDVYRVFIYLASDLFIYIRFRFLDKRFSKLPFCSVAVIKHFTEADGMRMSANCDRLRSTLQTWFLEFSVFVRRRSQSKSKIECA